MTYDPRAFPPFAAFPATFQPFLPLFGRRVLPAFAHALALLGREIAEFVVPLAHALPLFRVELAGVAALLDEPADERQRKLAGDPPDLVELVRSLSARFTGAGAATA